MLLKEVQVGNNLNLAGAVRNNVIFQADQLLLESDLLRELVVTDASSWYRQFIR